VRGSAATRVNAEGLIEDVATNIPRIDYTDGTASILLEPQSSNLLPYSEDFSQGAWVKTDCSVVSNFGVSPSGQTNASKLTFTTTNTLARAQHNLGGLTTGNTYTQSYYIKSLGADVTLRIGTSGAVVGEFTDIIATSEWKRFEFTGVASSTSEFPRVQNITGILGTEILVWGAQVEALPYATSYIPTSGAIATRLADRVTGAGDASTFNSTEGVLYVEMASLSNTVISNYISISDGTYNNRLTIFFTNGTNIIRAFYVNNGAVQVNKQFAASDITEFHKVALKYKENDFALWVDGVEVGVDTSGSTLPSGTLTKLSFSEINTTANAFRGKVKSVITFNTALTDAELECLTTI
jgi:hypothetical protein